MAKVLRVFLDTDMRNSHNGLSHIARKKGIDTDRLKDGQLVVFINRKRSLLKVYGADNSILFKRASSSREPINLETIQYLPRIFKETGKVSLSRALRMHLEKDD